MKNKSTTALMLFLLFFSSIGFSQDKIVQINFAIWGSNYTEWNKTSNSSPDLSTIVISGPVTDLSGGSHPISISIESQFDGINYNGMSSGIYPSDVVKRGYSVVSNEGILKIEGLDVSKKYDFTLFGSRNAYNNENFTTIYTEVTDGGQGQSTFIQAYKNANNTVELTGLLPNTSGEILLSVKKDPAALSGYINSLIITISDNVVQDQPDFVVISSSVDPLSIAAGNNITVTSTTQNQDLGIAPSSLLKYYLSVDSEYSLDDILLGDDFIDELSADETDINTNNLNVPASTIPGNYYVVFYVDADTGVSESNEDNNQVSQQISVLEPLKPDLTIQSSSLSMSNVRPEDALGINCIIENIGLSDAERSEIRYYLSEDNLLDVSDILLVEELVKDAVNGLLQGESAAISSNVQLPIGASVGPKYIILVLDEDNLIDESHEDNNVAIQAFSVLEPATTRYVSPSGSDAFGDGTIDDPYLSPEFAIEQANPMDEVHLLSGYYVLSDVLIIDKNISLTGENVETTELHKNFSPQYTDYSILTINGVDHCTVKNLRITTIANSLYDHTGIEIINSSNVIIEHCDINNVENGISVLNSQDYKIENCTFVVQLANPAEAGLLENNCSGDNVIRNTILYGFNPGIDIQNSIGVTSLFHNNLFNSPVNYSGISDQTGSAGNISSDPEFVDIYAYEHHLNASSPCINTGDDSSPIDPDGSYIEIGAYPYLPEIIYVSTSGSDVNGDGSMLNPYATIQNGIDKAFAYDTVQVASGNYVISEKITLKSGLYLRGDSPENTEIYRNFPYDQDLDFNIIEIDNASEITIKNFRLTTTISTSGNIHTGIRLNGSDGINIERCALSNLFNGIVSEYSSYQAINNTISGQLSGQSGSGIYSLGGATNSISNSIIAYFNDGIKVANPIEITINNNDVYASVNSNYTGITNPTGSLGNISVNPQFFDIYSNDFSLESTSPCIDAGDINAPLDPDGTRADIGAIPYNQSTVTPMELTSSKTEVSCFGGNYGSIDLTVSGGLPPYTFIWSNGETTEDLAELLAGTYSVTVTDQAAQEETLDIDISEPLELLLTLEQTGGACAGGALSIVITVSGGTAPYTYRVEGGDIEVIPETIVTVPAAEGSHVVTVYDGNNCSVTDNIDLSNSATETAEICVITVDEGTGNLSLVWAAQAGIEEHNIYRESSESDVFELIGTAGAGNSFYTDPGANPDIRSYRYKISALDLCGGETELSSIHKSMHLTVNIGLNDEVNLIWDAYEGFDYSSFNILRGPSEDNMTEHIATVPANIFSFTDLNPDVLNSYYQIEVVSNNPCGTASSGRISGNPSSRSNASSKIGAVTALQDDLISQVEIYPNPTNGYLNIKLPENLGNVIELEIRDITGQLMQRYSDFSVSRDILDVHMLNNGVYVLHMKLTPELTMNRKIIVNQ